MKYAIRIKNVTKGFTDKNQLMPKWLVSNSSQSIFYAVKDISVDIKTHEIFGILGPNGCGKSTLIRMITTLLTPDKGEVNVFGIDVIKNPDDVKKFINRVSVEASFFKRLSARENLLYASRLYGLDDKQATKKFVQILKELDFDEKNLDEQMMKFSRGMQQKVSIARGFITDPTIILLDEPTTGLDPKSKLDVQKFIRKLHAQSNLTIVISSHDMEEVERLCNRIAIMDKGKIIALGTSDELKELVMKENVYELATSNTTKTMNVLKNIKEIKNIRRENETVRFFAIDIGKVAENITSELRKNHIKFKHLIKVVPSLEDVFLELTGKSLEDEE